MADDDQIVIEIASDDDATAKTEPDRGADGKFVAREPKDELAAQFAELQAKSQRDVDALAAERRRREVAEQAALRASEEATTARGEVIESHVSSVESRLTAAQAEADAAEREYAAAFEAGDGVKMGAAQRKIARAEALISRLDEAKADLETRKVKAPVEADQRRTEAPQRREVSGDPTDAFIASRSERTAAWLREHKDWAAELATGAGPKASKLNAAHATAIDQGIEPDSDAYFEHVEKYIGIKPNGSTPTTKPRRPTVPAAPVNGSGGGGGNGGTEVILSRGEAAAAEDGTHVWNYDDPSPAKKFRKGDPIGRQEFARRKLAMTKQGMYDRTYVES